MTAVSVFGGTGFLGRRLVQRLASSGTSARVAVRHADRARSALHAEGSDRISIFGADVRDQATVAERWPHGGCARIAPTCLFAQMASHCPAAA
jgi:nucleoside-diphosphate-sugar epimerase